jgi:hypothetical protein
LLAVCLCLFSLLAATLNSWRHTPCWLSASVCSVYWQPLSTAGGTLLVGCLPLFVQFIGSHSIAGGTHLVGCLPLFVQSIGSHSQQLEAHTLSAVCLCLFNLLAATLHSWRHTPCRLSSAVYSVYWQPLSVARGTHLVGCLPLFI